jgi:hypothetical protein
MKHFLKSTPHSTLLFHHENTTEKYHFSNNSGTIYLHVCVFDFSSLFHIFLRKCILVWNALKHGVAHKPMLHSGHLNVILLALFIAEHTQHPVLFLSARQCLLCLVSSLFIWLMDGTCLLCLGVWVQGTHPVSYIRSLTIVSLKVDVIILNHRRWEWKHCWEW